MDWEPAMFSVAVPAGKRSQEGIVCGPFAIYRYGFHYTLTHVWSGKYIKLVNESEKAAKDVAWRLQLLKYVDWDSEEPLKGLPANLRAEVFMFMDREDI